MTDKQAKITAETMEELYLYPYRSKEENALRSGVWMASWLVGIVLQSAENRQTLGGAYFIYSLSLLLEFVPERRKRPLARIVHGLFCILLFIMLLGALVISFENSTKENLIFQITKAILPFAGWIVFIIMFVGMLFVFLEVHKYFYDEAVEESQELETKREIERKRFKQCLSGAPKGGNS